MMVMMRIQIGRKLITAFFFINFFMMLKQLLKSAFAYRLPYAIAAMYV